MDRPLSFMMVVVLALASGGCALLGLGGKGAEEEPEEPRVYEITLDVRNQNFYDATLYAVSGAYRERIGVVNGNGQESFSFRWPHLDLRVDIYLLAVGSYLTESLPVDEGDVVELTIMPDLHHKVRRR